MNFYCEPLSITSANFNKAVTSNPTTPSINKKRLNSADKYSIKLYSTDQKNRYAQALVEGYNDRQRELQNREEFFEKKPAHKKKVINMSVVNTGEGGYQIKLVDSVAEQ